MTASLISCLITAQKEGLESSCWDNELIYIFSRQIRNDFPDAWRVCTMLGGGGGLGLGQNMISLKHS